MNARQMKLTTLTIGLVLLLWIFCPLLLSRREPDLPLNSTPLTFSAELAYQSTREFTTQFPTRLMGSLESRQSTGYLHDTLVSLGYTVEYSHFEGRIGKRKQAGRNVLAYKQGASPEIVALVAHFDTAKPTLHGAMKNGAAVGVLLELAHIFSKENSHRSLLFIFSDGGEWGSLGVQDLLTNYPEKNRIIAALSLDHVGVGDLAGFRLEETGQLGGFTPPWLRQLVKQAVETQNLPVTSASGLQEHRERAFLIPLSDQGPFLKADIPAINLGSISTDVHREKAVLHSQLDTIDNLKLDSMRKYGRAAENVIRSLDRLQGIPKSSDSLKLWDGRYIGIHALHALHFLTFIPLLLVLIFHLKNTESLRNKAQIGRELLAYIVTSIPFWVLYFSIQLVHALRQFPLYSLYPAAAKDPIMANPPWKLLGGILGSALFIAIAVYIICKYALQSWPKPAFAVSKTVLLCLLSISVAFALSYNSFWALIFLTLPAWIWAIVDSQGTFSKRFRNQVIILAAGIPYCAFLWLFADQRGMGWSFLWYQVLALTTGLFSPTAYFLSVAAIAIGIRFLVIQNHEQS
jgi:hypothetical protein